MCTKRLPPDPLLLPLIPPRTYHLHKDGLTTDSPQQSAPQYTHHQLIVNRQNTKYTAISRAPHRSPSMAFWVCIRGCHIKHQPLPDDPQPPTSDRPHYPLRDHSGLTVCTRAPTQSTHQPRHHEPPMIRSVTRAKSHTKYTLRAIQSPTAT